MLLSVGLNHKTAPVHIGERLAFEFQRTVSRLSEMQTAAFLGRPHLG